MKIKILGSGGWEGVPAPFCSCRICRMAIERPKSKENRMRPEILVETGEGNFLIELSPDIRLQTARFNVPAVQHFFISHWHFDHMYGLLELHAWAKFSNKERFIVYCSDVTKKWLDKNFSHIPMKVVVLKPFQQVELFGVNIIPLPLKHMHPQDEQIEESELSNTFGYMLISKNKKIVYLPDYYKIPDATRSAIKNSDMLIADGTYLFEETFPDKPEQEGEKKDVDHVHGNAILELLRSFKAKKVFFHSITHLSEKTHGEINKMLPEDMYAAYDGMIIK